MENAVVDRRRSKKGGLFLSKNRKKKSTLGLRRWQMMKGRAHVEEPSSIQHAENMSAECGSALSDEKNILKVTESLLNGFEGQTDGMILRTALVQGIRDSYAEPVSSGSLIVPEPLTKETCVEVKSEPSEESSPADDHTRVKEEVCDHEEIPKEQQFAQTEKDHTSVGSPLQETFEIKIEPFEASYPADGRLQEEVSDDKEMATEGEQFVQMDDGHTSLVAEAVQIKAETFEGSSPADGRLQETAVSITVDPLGPSSPADGYSQEGVLYNKETPVEEEQFVPADEGQRSVASPLACFIREEDFEGNCVNLLNEWEDEYNENENPHVPASEVLSTDRDVQEEYVENRSNPRYMICIFPVKQGHDETRVHPNSQACEAPVRTRDVSPSLSEAAGSSLTSLRIMSKVSRSDIKERQKHLDLIRKLEIEMVEDKGKIVYRCHLCGKRCKRKWNLQEHIMTHGTEKPFACTTCGKRFLRNRNLALHQRVHKRKEF